MTFSTEIKNEITRLECSKTESIAELSAIVRNSASTSESIYINVENNAVARRIYKLFKDIYNITPTITIRKRYFNKGINYILEIKKNNTRILEDLSIIDNNSSYLTHPREYLIDDGENKRAYLRGLFIACGSVNDPKTSRYHLEFIVDSDEYAKYINTMLNEYSLNSRIIRREKNYMVYIKEAEKISDFLRIIKAYNGVMYFEDIRIYRDHKNMTNRLNNCEQANMDKVFLTSSNQIKDIDKLKELGLYDELDSKLKKVIDYRLKYPESSLQELSEIMTSEGEKITKSGLNHRFRKIKELIDNYKSNKK